ncbi:MAG TPA: phosphatidylinositol-specific phospholipase C1-like protein [Thermoanaerobaculia bacterium]|nr:phosphatidylinositol-specific phospholipase C1-like protein [Thermoanaerobaculia bacterium]
MAAAIAGSACAQPPPAADQPLRLNDLQVVGSHNSYKQAIDPALFALLLERRSPERIRPLEYGHPSLTEQLDRGLRKLELDVFHDPEGGRYAAPAGLAWLAERGDGGALRPYDARGEMKAPGFKVLHVQDLDFRSNCLTLYRCLEELRAWSDAHPRHLPIVVSMNAKDGALEGIDAVVPLPFDAPAFDTLDREILAVLPRQRLIVPDDVRGEHATLRDAVLANGWPAIEEARGRFLFVLDESGAKLERYVAGHPSLRGRAMFANAAPDRDEAAFLVVNDPVRDGARISELVARGFLVRTRADADTREARSGDTTRREAAFASGAHFVSTDYYLASHPESPAFGTGYQVDLPGGGVARCNPVRRPAAACSVVE